MELLQNIDDNVLEKIATDKSVLKMAIDILSALEDCEEKNIVHRDIKPDNIFVNSKGIYKLGDFGEAKNIEKTVSNMSKKGTENYMAPEIYKGERGSKSVDTYSLGIMLYKYFNNNRIPFLPEYPKQITFENREEALYKRMSGEDIKSPQKASNNLSKIILKACSYNPKDRYKSAMEFKDDIEKEYKQIKSPMKLFDFQEGEVVEENSISNCDATSGIFNEFNEENQLSEYDKTSGIFNEPSKKEPLLVHDTTVGIFGNRKIKEDEFADNLLDDKNQFGFKPDLNPQKIKEENSSGIKEIVHTENIKVNKEHSITAIDENAIKLRIVNNIKDQKLICTPLKIETYGRNFTELIAGNTLIPTSKTQMFSTSSKSMTFTILCNNTKKVTYSLQGFSPNSQIEVRFDIDNYGILHISARDKLTGNKLLLTKTAEYNHNQVSEKLVKKQEEERKEKIKTEAEQRLKQEHIFLYYIYNGFNYIYLLLVVASIWWISYNVDTISLAFLGVSVLMGFVTFGILILINEALFLGKYKQEIEKKGDL